MNPKSIIEDSRKQHDRFDEMVKEYKQAEEMLRKSEERYRNLFEEAPISLWEEDFSDVKSYIEDLRNSGVDDLRGYFENHSEEVVRCAALVKVVDVNKATLELYDAESIEEFMGNLGTIFGEESYDVFKEELIALVDGETIFETEGINRTLKGDKMYIVLRLFVPPGYEETLSKVLVCIIDITDRLRKEKELQDAHQLLETIFDHTHMMVAYLDPQFNFIRVNRAYAQADEREPSFFSGKNHFELYPNAENEELFRKVVETGEPHFEFDKVFEYTEHPERGMSYWDWSLVPIKDPDETVLALILTLQDVTERKQAEGKLRLLSSAVEQSHEGLAVSDLEGNLIFLNNAFADIHGYTPEELIGKHLSIFYTPEQMSAVNAAGQQIKETHGFDGEIWHVRHNGTVFPALMHNSILQDGTGKPIGMIGTLCDITERKQAEKQIKDSLKEKEVLLQEIHHRVKNNLQLISSLTDMSSMRTQDPQAANLLNNLRDKIYMMSLIHTQLYQSNSFAYIEMRHYIRQLVGYLSSIHATGKRIQIVVDVSDIQLSLTQAIPCACVLNELITNAFKHGFDDGQKGTVEISMQKRSDDTILIKVKNDGLPIPDDVNIYETNSLGLKLSRNLVQRQLKGEIWLERDEGTEFVVEFKIGSPV